MTPQGICATSEQTARQFTLDFNTTSWLESKPGALNDKSSNISTKEWSDLPIGQPNLTLHRSETSDKTNFKIPQAR